MNDLSVYDFNSQVFIQDGNDSTILKINYYNPPNLFFKLFPDEEKI